MKGEGVKLTASQGKLPSKSPAFLRLKGFVTFKLLFLHVSKLLTFQLNHQQLSKQVHLRSWHIFLWHLKIN